MGKLTPWRWDSKRTAPVQQVYINRTARVQHLYVQKVDLGRACTGLDPDRSIPQATIPGAPGVA
ncbi:MAG: hypothetical protein AAGK00_16850, partial [Pseudomonadota bacterium]